jgi:hypothetical protein
MESDTLPRQPARAKRNRREWQEWLHDEPVYHRTVNGRGEVGRLRKKKR